MSFDIVEQSDHDGTPIELFEFTRGSSIHRYTSHDEDITFGGSIYAGTYPIERTKVEASQDEGRAPIKIKASNDLPFAVQYVTAPPSDTVSVVIKRYHLNDTLEEVVVVWMGRVINVGFEMNEAILRCEPIFTSLKRPGLRRMYQTSCPHLLYGPSCAAVRTSFQLITTITVIDSTTYQSAAIGAQPPGYYTGGYMTWDNNGVIEKRAIDTHTGTSVTVNIPISDMVSGTSVTIFPGCDHALATCDSKFNNTDNYGGFPYIPTKNPFSGTSVF